MSLTNLNQTLADFVFDGIETELRAIQHFQGAASARDWWYKSFAHKYPDYRYDVVKEEVVKREGLREESLK